MLECHGPPCDMGHRDAMAAARYCRISGTEDDQFRQLLCVDMGSWERSTAGAISAHLFRLMVQSIRPSGAA